MNWGMVQNQGRVKELRLSSHDDTGLIHRLTHRAQASVFCISLGANTAASFVY